MVSIKHVLSSGEVERATFATGATTKVEPDGIGGLLLVVRDAQGGAVASFIAGLVLTVQGAA